MSNDLVLGGNGALALPTYLQGANLNVSKALLATAGTGGNRIGFKGNRFRIIVNGKEESVVEQHFIDVIVVGAVPAVSRIFYEGTYDQDTKTPPTCYSADGIAPPEDVKQRQSTKCDICPQNQKGSKIVNGMKVKACGYFQRLVVMLPGDTTLFRVDVKAMGLFGESKAAANKYNLRDYTKLVDNRGVDVAQLVTRLSFDVDNSVPKLLFSPARFISAEEFAIISEKVGTPEVDNMLRIDMQTVDLSNETDASTDGVAAAQQRVTQPAAQVEEVPLDATPEPEVKREEALPAGTYKTPKGTLIRMTSKATDEGYTYEDFMANDWTPTDLVKEGYAEVVQPPKPTPPPKPKLPPKPAATPAAPAKPPVPTKPAAPTKPAVPTRSAPPTVVKSAPPPPAEEAVTEVGSDSEIDDILASLD